VLALQSSALTKRPPRFPQVAYYIEVIFTVGMHIYILGHSIFLSTTHAHPPPMEGILLSYWALLESAFLFSHRWVQKHHLQIKDPIRNIAKIGNSLIISHSKEIHIYW